MKRNTRDEHARFEEFLASRMKHPAEQAISADRRGDAAPANGSVGVSMPALSAPVVIEFCKLCGWAYESWLNHRELFDCNPRAAELNRSCAGDTLNRLSIISQEHSLLQIAKLHDSAAVGGKINLGLEYVLAYGDWSDPVRKQLEVLAAKLNAFASQLRGARNRALSHNDLAAIVSGATLGAFAEGEDVEYFKDLQEFVDIVHDQVIGGPWPFNDLVKNDVVAFLTMIKP